MPHQYVLKDRYWKMRIAHPYSMLAACDQLAVTCGQAPIGEKGEVLFPGDLLRQTDQVIQTAQRILADAGMTPEDLERIVIFTSDKITSRLEACMNRFRAQAPDSSTIYLVPLPPLFYEDLLLEVDYYGIPHRASGQTIRSFTLQVDLDSDMSEFPERISESLKKDLDRHLPVSGGGRSNVVKLSCYAPTEKLSFWESLSRERLTWFPGCIPAISDVITASLPDRNSLILDFTCVNGTTEYSLCPVGCLLDRGHPEAVRCGPLLFTSSLVMDSKISTNSPSITEEVDSIMARHREILASQGMTFADVVKSSTFYEGAGSSQALHENMSARNAYYSEPGPGSTGLPVPAFPYKGKRTSIELIAAAQS